MKGKLALVAYAALFFMSLPASLAAAKQTYVGRFTVESFDPEFDGAFAQGDVFEFQFEVDYDATVLGNSVANDYLFAGTPGLTRVAGSGTWDAVGSFGSIFIGGVDLGFYTDLNIWLTQGSFTPVNGLNLNQIWFYLDLDYSLVPSGSTLSTMLGGARLEDVNGRSTPFNMNWSSSDSGGSVGGSFSIIPVPEPGATGLLALASLLALKRRRRL